MTAMISGRDASNYIHRYKVVSEDLYMTANEKKEQLQGAKGKIELANGFRLIFLFVGILLLLFLFFGNKWFEGTEWFISASVVAFRIAEWDIILLVISTFTKLFFTAQYNRLVKKS